MLREVQEPQKVEPVVVKVKKHKEVKIVEATGSCPYVDWYQFTSCTIKTCKNYTEQTARKCMAIDRVRPEGAKVISDAEIHMYKLHEAGISGRLVQIKRKKAVDRIKCMLILFKFINYLRLNKENGGMFNTPLLLEVEESYPFKINRLGWENWMWEYLLDETVWKEFLHGASGECNDYPLHQIISLKPVKFERLIAEFNLPYKGTDNEPSTSTKISHSSPSGKRQVLLVPMGVKQ